MYSQETLTLPRDEFQESASTNDSKTKSSPNLSTKQAAAKQPRPGVNFLFYYEDLDYLISGYEDSRICVWGYNEESIQLDPKAEIVGDQLLVGEGVNNRVAGMSLKATLLEHKEAVTCFTCFKHNDKNWMISAGWDRRLCIWNLDTLKLADIFRSSDSAKEELAADGIILSIDYSPERNEFGYTSSDKLAYIRKFSPGGDLKLVAVLQGHEAEVTVIKWHAKHRQWITGSEDRSIRIWVLPIYLAGNRDSMLKGNQQ